MDESDALAPASAVSTAGLAHAPIPLCDDGSSSASSDVEGSRHLAESDSGGPEFNPKIHVGARHQASLPDFSVAPWPPRPGAAAVPSAPVAPRRGRPPFDPAEFARANLTAVETLALALRPTVVDPSTAAAALVELLDPSLRRVGDSPSPPNPPSLVSFLQECREFLRHAAPPFRFLFVGSGVGYLPAFFALSDAMSDTPSLVRIVEPDRLTFQAVRLLLTRLSVAWDSHPRTSSPPTADDLAERFASCQVSFADDTDPLRVGDCRFSLGPRSVVELLHCSPFDSRAVDVGFDLISFNPPTGDLASASFYAQNVAGGRSYLACYTDFFNRHPPRAQILGRPQLRLLDGGTRVVQIRDLRPYPMFRQEPGHVLLDQSSLRPLGWTLVAPDRVRRLLRLQSRVAVYSEEECLWFPGFIIGLNPYVLHFDDDGSDDFTFSSDSPSFPLMLVLASLPPAQQRPLVPHKKGGG